MTDEKDIDYQPPCEYCEGTGKDKDDLDPVDGLPNDCYYCNGSGLGDSERTEAWKADYDWNFGRI